MCGQFSDANRQARLFNCSRVISRFKTQRVFSDYYCIYTQGGSCPSQLSTSAHHFFGSYKIFYGPVIVCHRFCLKFKGGYVPSKIRRIRVPCRKVNQFLWPTLAGRTFTWTREDERAQRGTCIRYAISFELMAEPRAPRAPSAVKSF